MSYCDDKKLALRISEEARQELETNLKSGIEGIIEAPYNNTKALKNKTQRSNKNRRKEKPIRRYKNRARKI